MKRRNFIKAIPVIALTPAMLNATEEQPIKLNEHDVITIKGYTGFDGNLQKFKVTSVSDNEISIQPL